MSKEDPEESPERFLTFCSRVPILAAKRRFVCFWCESARDLSFKLSRSPRQRAFRSALVAALISDAALSVKSFVTAKSIKII